MQHGRAGGFLKRLADGHPSVAIGKAPITSEGMYNFEG